MRILVVEDDPVLSDGLKVGLGLYGATLDIVSNCADGHAALAADEFDALVLDLMLPDGSGLDLLTALRSRGDRTPVLLLTALDEVPERIKGLDAGADDYLGKPFDLEELAARVRAISRRNEGRATPQASYNGVTLKSCAADGDRQWNLHRSVPARVRRSGGPDGPAGHSSVKERSGGKTLRLAGRGRKQHRRSPRAQAAHQDRAGQDRNPARDRIPDEACRIMNSLKSRLFLILVAATSLIWLAATCLIYVGATREVESVLDARLQEAARMVLSLASGNGVGAAQKDGNSGQAPEILNYERQLSCQIWSLDGRLVARSSGAPNESLSDKRAGFSERHINGETWRVYTAEDTARGVRVLVGDRLGLREHLVEEIIKGLLAPLLLTIPLLGLLIWASLSRGLRPLQALAQELGRRNADDMSPVETGTIPAEIRPVISSLNNLFLKVLDAMRHEREITAFAAHELRTPLAGLRTQAQIAMVAKDSATRDAALRQIIFAVDRTTRMVRQLLAMAKLDSNHEPKRSSINIGDLIQEVIELVAGVGSERTGRA